MDQIKFTLGTFSFPVFFATNCTQTTKHTRRQMTLNAIVNLHKEEHEILS
jgi:hypothetical protein